LGQKNHRLLISILLQEIPLITPFYTIKPLTALINGYLYQGKSELFRSQINRTPSEC